MSLKDRGSAAPGWTLSPLDPNAAPPVVAVVVSHNPGPWFEEVLESLRDQTYAEMSVLVLDAASDEDLGPRVAAVLPDAYIRRLDENPGYGATVNSILNKIKGAAFYLLCHDDVALDPNATQVLVQQAFRSNAGVVGAKLVQWDDLGILLQVGLTADRTGVPAPIAEPGELDQSQHDTVRDVFAVPGGCILIRTDLFEAIEGFDPGITFHGDDVDLCWRAHLAGARVLVAPQARVRHRQALGERRPDDRRRLQQRHRLRTMLTSYRPIALIRVLPHAVLHTILEVLFALLLGRGGQARELLGAWTWNLRRIRQLWRKRRQIRKLRRVPDSEIRRLQSKGSARLRSFVRGQIGRNDTRLNAFRSSFLEFGAELRSPTRRIPILAAGIVVTLLLLGSRHLITRGVPAVGEFAPFPSDPQTLWNEWTSGWRTAGLGSEAPAPTSYGMLGALGTVFFGSMGLLRQVLILGLLPVGAWGAWRMARPLGSVLAALASLIVYVAIPVPYNSLATGSWGGLVMYALSPWLLLTLARATRLAPFGPLKSDTGIDRPPPEDPSTPPSGRPLGRQILVLGLLLALGAAIVPFVLAVALLSAVALTIGSVVIGTLRGTGRLLGTAFGGVAVAIALHLPWALDFARPGGEWVAFAGVRSSMGGTRSVDELLRFESGPFGGPPYGWAFLVAAALPLMVGRRWRLEWAVRAWFLALGAWAVLWAGQEGWLPVGLPQPEILLAPAAAGLALAVGLGAMAFQVDLPGYRFGWRQLASVITAVAVLVGALPLLGGIIDGRWKTPTTDLTTPLADFDRTEGRLPSRVLWIGDPDALPVAGWEFDDRLAYATTEHLAPDVRDLWAGSSRDATGRIVEALEAVTEGNSTRLGRLLGPMGIRYVVVPLALTDDGGHRRPPLHLTDALAQQLDLERVELNPALVVYRNRAWMPMGATIDDDVPRSQVSDAALTDLALAAPVLERRRSTTRYTGEVDEPGTVLTAIADSDRWELTVDGERARRRTAWGWANEFEVEEPGPAQLRYRTSDATRVLLGIQGVLWIVALVLLGRSRRRSASALKVGDA